MEELLTSRAFWLGFTVLVLGLTFWYIGKKP